MGITHSARLIEVLNIKLESLSKDFLDYDTDWGKYPLPQKGDYLMLIFQKPESEGTDLFTTLRRQTPQKEEYYRNQIGKTFGVEVGQDAK